MKENNLKDQLPIAPLKIAALESCKHLAGLVNRHIVDIRNSGEEQITKKKESLHYRGYDASSYLLNVSCPRFGTGEAKGVIAESVRGSDLFIMADITNYSLTYSVSGSVNHMSPDDHFQDLKRIVNAGITTAHRVNVIMPFLYESRQHKRTKRESLDCATALTELVNMGVSNIITFDAHDPRVQNSIPLSGFDSFSSTYQFVQSLCNAIPDLDISKDSLTIISPDEGAMDRAVYLANILGTDMGMFYKRRDYSRVVDGRNPIVAHEFLGSSVEGKTVVILDDIISSGESMLETAKELKQRGAERVIAYATFGLFTNGIKRFDECYQNGIIDYICTTNLNYKNPELYSQPWYLEADMSRYLAMIIDSYNHDSSMSISLTPSEKIRSFLRSRSSDGYEYFGTIE